jgi:hypothetical protein
MANLRRKVAKTFPKYHPQAGELTLFKPQILNSIEHGINDPWTKHHTIRSGKKVKVGDVLILEEWSGEPYRSKVDFLAKVEVVKTWDFKISNAGYFINDKLVEYEDLRELAINDGLHIDDFKCWFSKEPEFDGQIICWCKDINY